MKKTKNNAIYEEILSLLKKEKVRVHHYHLGTKIGGYFDPQKDCIVVCKTLYGTKTGIETLLHEYTHFKDFHAGKFKSFFDGKVKKYSKKEMNEVVRAEQSAARGAKRIAAKYGIELHPEELTEKGLILLKAFWLERYFKN